MGTYLDKPRVEKSNESGSGPGIRYAVGTMQGWRIEMEDAHVARTDLEFPLDNCGFFAVFDGHAGNRVARHAAAHLLDVFLNSEEMQVLKEIVREKGHRPDEPRVFGDEEVEIIQRGLRNAFLKLDDQMRSLPDLSGDNEKSGSTVICTLIAPSHIFVANLGDSRALLCQEDALSFATEDHKPYLPRERDRIIKAGGSVMIDRVNGSLAVSRALGDYEYKSVGGLDACDQLVSPEPDVFVIPRNASQPCEQFMLLACDGIFDVTNNQELCDFILSRLRVNDDLAIVCNEILDTCLSKDSRDNMSVVLVALPGAPKVCSEAVERERELENLLRTKIQSIVESCNNVDLATYQYVIKSLIREQIPGLPSGSGLHALRSKVERILDDIRHDARVDVDVQMPSDNNVMLSEVTVNSEEEEEETSPIRQ